MPLAFPRTGLVSLALKGPITLGAPTWWAEVRIYHFPQPVKLGSRVTCWRAEEVCALIEEGVGNAR